MCGCDGSAMSPLAGRAMCDGAPARRSCDVPDMSWCEQGSLAPAGSGIVPGRVGSWFVAASLWARCARSKARSNCRRRAPKHWTDAVGCTSDECRPSEASQRGTRVWVVDCCERGQASERVRVHSRPLALASHAPTQHHIHSASLSCTRTHPLARTGHLAEREHPPIRRSHCMPPKPDRPAPLRATNSQPTQPNRYTPYPGLSLPAGPTTGGAPARVLAPGHYMASADSHAQAGPSASNEAVINTADRSCNRCRERRVRCDRVHPLCSRCAKRSEPCTWPEQTQVEAATGPKPVSPWERIDELQNQLGQSHKTLSPLTH